MEISVYLAYFQYNIAHRYAPNRIIHIQLTVNFIKCNVGVVEAANNVHEENLLQTASIILDDVKVEKENVICFYVTIALYRDLDLGICTEFELEVFPKRMTTWLGEVLDTLVCFIFEDKIHTC